MDLDMKRAAMTIGAQTVEATAALSTAITLTCNSMSTLITSSDELGMPELGSGVEMTKMVDALKEMVLARRAQVSSRVRLLGKARELGLEAFYGENCPCSGPDQPKGQDRSVQVDRVAA